MDRLRENWLDNSIVIVIGCDIIYDDAFMLTFMGSFLEFALNFKSFGKI